ncbi:MAG TPA: hypothetical protein VNW94_17755 [Streptosporangiaceae bacterium]|nr:hypothetical protein [Streptosporangiaceae bacterium]
MTFQPRTLCNRLCTTAIAPAMVPGAAMVTALPGVSPACWAYEAALPVSYATQDRQRPVPNPGSAAGTNPVAGVRVPSYSTLVSSGRFSAYDTASRACRDFIGPPAVRAWRNCMP